jgi:anion-transporting  ArsA/GET3 family ATPase
MILDRGAGRLLLCLGAGGVGKTTIACALALRSALQGRAVDVLTIDPAPRLLDCLGLDAQLSHPQRVALEELASGAGRLHALKLDPKHTFDAMVNRYAPAAAVAQAILDNRLYRNLSSALSWVGDYMAMEKLLELYQQPQTDLVVVDTPPAGEALDFLDAPRRLLDLLNSRALTLLGTFQRGLKFSDFAARAVLTAFDRVTRLHLLSDVQSFVGSFEGMFQNFAERAAQAAEVLHNSDVTVLLVTTAADARVEETGEFLTELTRAGVGVGGVIVNRITPPVSPRPRFPRGIAAGLRRRLEQNWRDFAALKEREQDCLQRLGELLPPGAVMLRAPELGHEPSSLVELASLARQIELVR